ncbi:hypothetical protein CC1G_05890 [Coprinopsis cinerea okayama7|uniref:Uncharacterized protein n=1 Tax=Coprinopsis cinerea (strain Okayama-7 / 130 / ATCC MYA-4618 / FGSC 9003) TaxID=240176 RepID=A8NAD9_COPC7|nr:hypothetical protein CC1G_05890 [Coprinopsis cinerea okayama7\|eukprot:XP_001831791.2 hypothetical protein CC1G_05890 [Coprinopsis cinerea okayama7\
MKVDVLAVEIKTFDIAPLHKRVDFPDLKNLPMATIPAKSKMFRYRFAMVEDFTMIHSPARASDCEETLPAVVIMEGDDTAESDESDWGIRAKVKVEARPSWGLELYSVGVDKGNEEEDTDRVGTSSAMRPIGVTASYTGRPRFYNRDHDRLPHQFDQCASYTEHHFFFVPRQVIPESPHRVAE